MTKFLVVLLCALAFVPLAQAHASPNPLDVEVQILADEASDNFAYYDGFDIQDLYIREGYNRQLEESGIILRPILYGGPGPAPVAAEQQLDIHFTAADTAYTYRMTTSDGLDWEGDATVMENSMEASAEGVGVEGSIQIFIPYAELGVTVGDSLSDFSMVTLADDDPRDISPGGYYLPGSGGAVDLPGDGRVVTDSYELVGTGGYTQSTLKVEDGIHKLDVTNRITVIGQHLIFVLPTSAPGWTFEAIETAAVSIEPGIHTEFSFKATSDETADMLELFVTSDLGGRERIELHPSEHTPDGETPATEGPTPVEESPGAPLALLLVGLVAIALARRK